jgi:uncharacterized RDD family membrane protein YckC
MSEFFDENNKQSNSSGEEQKETNGANNLNESKFAEDQQNKFRTLMPDYSPQFSLWDYRVGFGRRFGAGILDAVFLGIISGILYYATGILDQIVSLGFAALTDPEIMLEFAKDSVPISLLVTVIYYSTEILLSGTPGKHLLGIIIADSEMMYASYSKLGFRFLLKHIDIIFLALYVITWSNIMNTLSSVFSWVVFIAFFFVLRASKESLYDSIAKTAVYFKKEVDSNQDSKSMNKYNNQL